MLMCGFLFLTATLGKPRLENDYLGDNCIQGATVLKCSFVGLWIANLTC